MAQKESEGWREDKPKNTETLGPLGLLPFVVDSADDNLPPPILETFPLSVRVLHGVLSEEIAARFSKNALALGFDDAHHPSLLALFLSVKVFHLVASRVPK